jgi:hypothetical protein
MELLLVVLTPRVGGIFEASRCHSKVRYWNKWLRRMVRYAAARYEPMARYFSGVVSRLCICSLHAVVTVLFHARLNIQNKVMHDCKQFITSLIEKYTICVRIPHILIADFYGFLAYLVPSCLDEV